ncbi:GNAT family N-acetyltransferase [Antarctobacter jejuensis]|uniref:GNAT family N-acetyltransferase n=1 Tax=Antarctobacter jejuensis TaxID=1439938 RepID=UPI003FD2AA5C
MTAFSTKRLRVTPWETSLDDPAARATLENRLARMLTPSVLEHLPPDFGPDDEPQAMARWISVRRDRAKVSLVKQGHDLIGLLFLFRTEGTAPGDLHLGYLLAEEAWGKGYATELLQGLIAHLRPKAPMTLCAGVAHGNPASSRVLLKAGFAVDTEHPTAETCRYCLQL